MIKKFLMKQALKSQLKGVPEEQANMILDIVEKNPALFEQIAKETQEEVKKGKEQNAAALIVMNRHKAELEKLMRK